MRKSSLLSIFLLPLAVCANNAYADYVREWTFKEDIFNGVDLSSASVQTANGPSLSAYCDKSDVVFKVFIQQYKFKFDTNDFYKTEYPYSATMSDYSTWSTNEMKVEYRVDSNQKFTLHNQNLMSNNNNNIMDSITIDIDKNSSALLFNRARSGDEIAFKLISSKGKSLIFRATLKSSNSALSKLKSHCQKNYVDI